jgi:hypothetical protein
MSSTAVSGAAAQVERTWGTRGSRLEVNVGGIASALDWLRAFGGSPLTKCYFRSIDHAAPENGPSVRCIEIAGLGVAHEVANLSADFSSE